MTLSIWDWLFHPIRSSMILQRNRFTEKLETCRAMLEEIRAFQTQAAIMKAQALSQQSINMLDKGYELAEISRVETEKIQAELKVLLASVNVHLARMGAS